jgi:hypothetical protein
MFLAAMLPRKFSQEEFFDPTGYGCYRALLAFGHWGCFLWHQPHAVVTGGEVGRAADVEVIGSSH